VVLKTKVVNKKLWALSGGAESPRRGELCCVSTTLSKHCLQKYLPPIQEAFPTLREKIEPTPKQVI